MRRESANARQITTSLKGKRNEMVKWLNGYRIRLVSVVLVATIVIGGGGNAHADFIFGTTDRFEN
jgi:hypothetical protein